MTKDRINNASFRQKLDSISKNIRGQNLLELAFDSISTFDAENPFVGSLLKELGVGKKEIASELLKKVPRPPIRKRLEKLKNRPEPKDDDNNFNLSRPPSPPRPPSLGPQPPRRPLGPPLVPPFQRPTAQPRPPPPLESKGFIGIPPAPSAPPLSPDDYFLLGPSA